MRIHKAFSSLLRKSIFGRLSKVRPINLFQLIYSFFFAVRKSDTILELSSILSSLSPSSLSSHLATLRRDITTHYIDHILSQPCSITVSPSSGGDHQLSQFPSPPNSEDRTARLENMCTILTFLQTNLFAVLPPSQNEAFPKSLCKPLSIAILNRLLIPSLPSSLSLLPAFLELVKRATEFEYEYIVGILGNAAHDREIKAWADGVSGHYERKRRMDILESARVVIVDTEDDGTFMAELAKQVAEPEVIPVQGGESVQEDTDASWGLDEGSKDETDENGWGFDDEEEPEPGVEREPTAEQNDDPADAWGWNDEETAPVDDDPWAEELDEPARPPAAPSISKSASRLEKSSVKGKGPHTNGTSSTKLTDTRPRQITTKATPMETYLVSGRTKNIIRLVENALHESQEFASSQLFSSSISPPGTLILRSALSIFDLYRALYPVTFGAHFALSLELALRFSNDCLYLSEETGKLAGAVPGDSPLKQNFEDTKENLKVLGDSWFEDSIASVLDGSQFYDLS
jgi:centromere/kinetochore protein ZW10